MLLVQLEGDRESRILVNILILPGVGWRIFPVLVLQLHNSGGLLAQQVRHLDGTDKSELQKLQLLKDELGVSFVLGVDYTLFLDCYDIFIASCVLIQDYCKLYLLFLLENKDQAVYDFRHSTFISMHNDQKWVRYISSHHGKHLHIFYQKLSLSLVLWWNVDIVMCWPRFGHLYLGANLFCLTI